MFILATLFPSDEPAWRRLWEGYVAFYGADVPEEVTAKTWERLIRKQDGFVCRIAETGGEACGFSLSCAACRHLDLGAHLLPRGSVQSRLTIAARGSGKLSSGI